MQSPLSILSEAYGDADAFLRYWAPALRRAGARLVDAMPVEGVADVLDLGCGPGTNLATIRDRYPSASVIAVDLVEPLLRAAPTEVPRAVMDAASTGFADESFDAVVMAFMLFHVPNPGAALAEAHRIVRPGGHLAVGTWSTHTPFPAEEIWVTELDLAGAAPTPPTVSRSELMDTPEKVGSLLTDAGFHDVVTRTEIVDDPMTMEEFIDSRTRLGASRRRLATLDPAARSAFLARVRPRLEALEPDDFAAREPALLTWARR